MKKVDIVVDFVSESLYILSAHDIVSGRHDVDPDLYEYLKRNIRARKPWKLDGEKRRMRKIRDLINVVVFRFIFNKNNKRKQIVFFIIIIKYS